MKTLLNTMRREAAQALNQKAFPRRGVVTAYDPINYSAKVSIQPEGTETGFIPIGCAWVGNGWGMFCPPSPGDEVDVFFQEGGKNAPYIALRFYGNSAQPLAVPSGEFWLVHQSGANLQFTNDGKVFVNSNESITMTAPNVNVTGNLNVVGDIIASGDISDFDGVEGSIDHIRSVYNTHNHDDPVSGITGSPNQPL